ncbi:MAG: PAS domain-containing sensor histidine kinase [Niabella sp.]|nr:PAS domain-containing sensor histidine kinase [Niabella sp.]
MNKLLQVVICLLITACVVVICFITRNYTGYKTTALILLTTTSLIAMLFDRWAVISTAVVSAFAWNFFFIPPLFTLHITNAEDALMFFLYFFIALVNTVLTVKIRDTENKARDKEESERALLLYNTLLNSLSHELRTPLAAIIGGIDALRANNESTKSINNDLLLDEVEQASLRLNEQVEHLLNIGRIESGLLKPNTDWVDVGEVIHNIKNNLRKEAAQKIIYSESEDLPLFKLDARMLSQIIYNVVVNAIKHTPVQTTIRIDAENDQEHCLITIADDGQGIPEADLAQIFDKFYRVHQEKAGGLGLGLSIVKGFTEAMQGTVTVVSTTVKGTIFTIRIPAETSYIGRLKNE